MTMPKLQKTIRNIILALSFFSSLLLIEGLGRQKTDDEIFKRIAHLEHENYVKDVRIFDLIMMITHDNEKQKALRKQTHSQ